MELRISPGNIYVYSLKMSSKHEKIISEKSEKREAYETYRKKTKKGNIKDPQGRKLENSKKMKNKNSSCKIKKERN